MYIKECDQCTKNYQCDFTYEPDKCECGGTLTEHKEATVILQQQYKDNAPQHCKDARLGITGVRKVSTLGQLADENARRIGRQEVEERLIQNKTKKTPCGDNSKRPMDLPRGSQRKTMTPTKIDKDLMNATPKELEKYVRTGERPIPKAEPTLKELKKRKSEVKREKLGNKTRIISTGAL